MLVITTDGDDILTVITDVDDVLTITADGDVPASLSGTLLTLTTSSLSLHIPTWVLLLAHPARTFLTGSFDWAGPITRSFNRHSGHGELGVSTAGRGLHPNAQVVHARGGDGLSVSL